MYHALDSLTRQLIRVFKENIDFQLINELIWDLIYISINLNPINRIHALYMNIFAVCSK